MFKKLMSSFNAPHVALAMTALLDPHSRANAHSLLRLDQGR